MIDNIIEFLKAIKASLPPELTLYFLGPDERINNDPYLVAVPINYTEEYARISSIFIDFTAIGSDVKKATDVIKQLYTVLKQRIGILYSYNDVFYMIERVSGFKNYPDSAHILITITIKINIWRDKI